MQYFAGPPIISRICLFGPFLLENHQKIVIFIKKAQKYQFFRFLSYLYRNLYKSVFLVQNQCFLRFWAKIKAFYDFGLKSCAFNRFYTKKGYSWAFLVPGLLLKAYTDFFIIKIEFWEKSLYIIPDYTPFTTVTLMWDPI